MPIFPQKEEGNKEEGDCELTKNQAQEQHISQVIDAGFHLHKELGPGLLESVYETILASRLKRIGFQVARQMPVNITIDGVEFYDAYRVDLFVNGWRVVEIKALEKLAGVHIRQAQTYVKLLNQPSGLILNFGAETFGQGVRRIYNNRQSQS
ncbi:GxxExxY protein [Sphingorhabdus sp.]|uniref:GxxExxY protein n=1 Tax=Sphingorhabdus sp. TaxID=1902408 RepID=UPI003BAED6B5